VKRGGGQRQRHMGTHLPRRLDLPFRARTKAYRGEVREEGGREGGREGEADGYIRRRRMGIILPLSSTGCLHAFSTH